MNFRYVSCGSNPSSNVAWYLVSLCAYHNPACNKGSVGSAVTTHLCMSWFRTESEIMSLRGFGPEQGKIWWNRGLKAHLEPVLDVESMHLSSALITEWCRLGTKIKVGHCLQVRVPEDMHCFIYLKDGVHVVCMEMLGCQVPYEYQVVVGEEVGIVWIFLQTVSSKIAGKSPSCYNPCAQSRASCGRRWRRLDRKWNRSHKWNETLFVCNLKIIFILFSYARGYVTVCVDGHTSVGVCRGPRCLALELELPGGLWASWCKC